MFGFNSFYKELAWAYGVGLRLDFNYFLLRLDLGMKAYNPAYNQEPWPLLHPGGGATPPSIFRSVIRFDNKSADTTISDL